MKILKRGKSPAKQIYRHTCDICKTHFECKGQDGWIEKAYSGTKIFLFLHIKCPVCKYEITFRIR